MVRYRAVGLGLFIASVVTASAVHAAGPRLLVVYEAPNECPTAAVFEQQVQRLRPEVTDASRSSLDVQIERDSRGFRGTLRMPESSDASLSRELYSRDCMELVKALALVGAVLIDPDARARADAIEPEGAPRTPGSNAGPDVSPAQRGRSAATARTTAPRSSRRPDAAKPTRSRSDPSASARWSFVAAAGLQVQSAVAPNPALGPRLSAGVRRWSASGLYGVEGRLSFTRTWGAEIQKTVGDARMRWTAGRAELCAPFRVGEGAAVSLCAMMDLGEISSTASRAANATTRGALWAAPGGLLRAEIVLVGPLAVLVEAAAARPLVRPQFYFARADRGHDVVYDVPAAAFGAGVGLGAEFP